MTVQIATEGFTKLVDRVIAARAGGAVERCHVIRHTGSYTVATHSWGVAMLALQLFPGFFQRIAGACLVHDVPEYLVGDIPATMKRYVESLKEETEAIEQLILENLELQSCMELSDDEKMVVKFCDCLEFYLWCKDQDSLGNKFASEGEKEICSYLNNWSDPFLRLVWLEFKTAVERRGGVTPIQAGMIKKLMENIDV